MSYAWSTDSLIPNDENAYGISGPPAVVEFIDKLYLIHEGRGSDGYLWCATFDGQTWSDDNLIPDTNHAYGTSGPPAAVVFNDKLYCIREGRGGNGWMWYATFDGRTWSRDALLPNSRNAFGTSGRPALAVYNEKLYCVHEGRGDDGWVWCATFDGENWSQDEPIPNSGDAYGTSGRPPWWCSMKSCTAFAKAAATADGSGALPLTAPSGLSTNSSPATNMPTGHRERRRSPYLTTRCIALVRAAAVTAGFGAPLLTAATGRRTA